MPTPFHVLKLISCNDSEVWAPVETYVSPDTLPPDAEDLGKLHGEGAYLVLSASSIYTSRRAEHGTYDVIRVGSRTVFEAPESPEPLFPANAAYETVES